MVSKASLALIALFSLLAWATSAAAHAELESSVPAADATVASAPLTLDLTFSEEVAVDGATIRVLGPAGGEVQAGTAELDLNDPERRHVTLSLQANLPPGRYAVEWTSTSNVDGDTATGAFAFTVGGPAMSPAASPAAGGTPVATPVGTPGAVAGSVRAEATLDPDLNGNALASEDGNFDSRGFAVSVAAGLVVVAALVFFWRAVRPRNPVFGGRSRG